MLIRVSPFVFFIPLWNSSVVFCFVLQIEIWSVYTGEFGWLLAQSKTEFSYWAGISTHSTAPRGRVENTKTQK